MARYDVGVLDPCLSRLQLWAVRRDHLGWYLRNLVHRVLQILKACEAGGFPYTCEQCGHQGNKHLDIKELEWVGRVKERRFPEDYGTSAHHRKPETEPSGDAWHERNGLNHAQLVHMLSQPPDEIAKALVAAADNIYELLLASGWQPKEK